MTTKIHAQTAAEKRQESLDQFNLDWSHLRDAEAGDDLDRWTVLARMSNRASYNSYYASFLDKYLGLSVLSRLEELRPSADVIRLDRAWVSLSSRLLAALNHENDRILAFADQLIKVVKEGGSLDQEFTWSERSFEAAARATIYASLHHRVSAIDKHKTDLSTREKFDLAKRAIAGELERRTGERSRSSLPTANLMEDCLRVAWAKLADKQTSFESGADL